MRSGDFKRNRTHSSAYGSETALRASISTLLSVSCMSSSWFRQKAYDTKTCQRIKENDKFTGQKPSWPVHFRDCSRPLSFHLSASHSLRCLRRLIRLHSSQNHARLCRIWPVAAAFCWFCACPWLSGAAFEIAVRRRDPNLHREFPANEAMGTQECRPLEQDQIRSDQKCPQQTNLRRPCAAVKQRHGTFIENQKEVSILLSTDIAFVCVERRGNDTSSSGWHLMWMSELREGRILSLIRRFMRVCRIKRKSAIMTYQTLDTCVLPNTSYVCVAYTGIACIGSSHSEHFLCPADTSQADKITEIPWMSISSTFLVQSDRIVFTLGSGFASERVCAHNLYTAHDMKEESIFDRCLISWFD